MNKFQHLVPLRVMFIEGILHRKYLGKFLFSILDHICRHRSSKGRPTHWRIWSSDLDYVCFPVHWWVPFWWKTWRVPPGYPSKYRKSSNIRRTKFQNLNESHLVLKSSLPNPLKPGVQSRMKMWLEKRRQAMLQLHLSDRQFNCLLRCILYLTVH